MRNLLVASAMLITTAALAQSAKVIALSPEDTKVAASLDAQQKALNEKIEAFHNHVVVTYLADGQPTCASISFGNDIVSKPCHSVPRRVGWENGFEFSDDWRYIVPIKYNGPLSILGGTQYNVCTSPVFGAVTATSATSTLLTNY